MTFEIYPEYAGLPSPKSKGSFKGNLSPELDEILRACPADRPFTIRDLPKENRSGRVKKLIGFNLLVADGWAFVKLPNMKYRTRKYRMTQKGRALKERIA
jgi:hypothetical protein